jgi:hypothetical protein
MAAPGNHALKQDTSDYEARNQSPAPEHSYAQLSVFIGAPAIAFVAGGGTAGEVAAWPDLSEQQPTLYCNRPQAVCSGAIAQLASVIPSPAVALLPGCDPAGEGIPSAYAREAQSAGYRDRSRPNSRRAVAKLETSSTAARRETTEIHYAENCISRFVPGGSDESYGPNATR